MLITHRPDDRKRDHHDFGPHVHIQDITTSRGSELSDTVMQRPCTKRGDVGDVGSGPAMLVRTAWRNGKILAPGILSNAYNQMGRGDHDWSVVRPPGSLPPTRLPAQRVRNSPTQQPLAASTPPWPRRPSRPLRRHLHGRLGFALATRMPIAARPVAKNAMTSLPRSTVLLS